jgi:sigma-B regulation protein RsbU (phosphoserine phosphatase)
LSAPDDAVPAWETLYDGAACGLLLTDRAGLVLRANRTFCRWLGSQSGNLVGRRRFQDLLTMGGRIFHQTHWAPLLQIQGSISEVKLDLVHAEGHSIPMMMNAVTREYGGTVFHELALFVAEDRNKYERELMRARNQAQDLLAQQQDRALFAEQMVGIVSHDLRSPLSSVTLGADLLARTNPTPQQQLVLANVSRSVKRARKLIDDLLDFTMARVGRGLTVNVQPIDTHAAIASHLLELGAAYPGRAIVHRQTGTGICRADADRIFQLVSNLVANAMSYGDPVSAVTVSSDIGKGSFSLTVHNRGPAIPESSLAGLFQPMVRGTDDHAGTRSVGLGLYIVSEIARAHGGDVTVRSNAEDGTRFTATFPTAVCG